jgi:hypothetical protein
LAISKNRNAARNKKPPRAESVTADCEMLRARLTDC